LTIIMTIDKIVVMNDISISEFKAKCLGLIEQVHKTRQPLRITRHGRPVAEVIPAGPDRKRKFVGDMIGTAKIVGDIVSPVIDLDEFEVYRD
jgi:prevent-host-death family protein